MNGDQFVGDLDVLDFRSDLASLVPDDARTIGQAPVLSYRREVNDGIAITNSAGITLVLREMK